MKRLVIALGLATSLLGCKDKGYVRVEKKVVLDSVVEEERQTGYPPFKVTQYRLWFQGHSVPHRYPMKAGDSITLYHYIDETKQ